MSIEEQLAEPFGVEDIEWRVQSSGMRGDKKDQPWAMVLAYVTARAVQKRLDDVFGVLGWKDTYRHVEGGVVCSLSCLDKDSAQWVLKENGSPETHIEAFKGGISKAFVRVAASGYGIGRYLYDLDTAFVKHVANGKRYDVIKDKQHKKIGEIKWNEPGLPTWALPKDPRPEADKSDIVERHIRTMTEIADELDYEGLKAWWPIPGNGDKIKNIMSEDEAKQVHGYYLELLKEKEAEDGTR